MKRIMHLVSLPIATAFFAASTCWAEPTLDSVLPSDMKEPTTPHNNYLGIQVSIALKKPTSTHFSSGTGDCMDASFAKREPFNNPVGPSGQTLLNQPTGPAYYEFSGKGRLDWHGESSANDFELILAQNSVLAGAPLGTLKITFGSGKGEVKTFTLPDSLIISENRRFIQGELDGGNAVITLLISGCGTDGGCN